MFEGFALFRRASMSTPASAHNMPSGLFPKSETTLAVASAPYSPLKLSNSLTGDILCPSSFFLAI
jgi:hypothetical protein